MKVLSPVIRLTFLVLALLTLFCGARLSKDTARKILDNHFSSQPVIESVQFRVPDADFSITDPLMTPDFSVTDQARRAALFAQRLLFSTPRGQELKTLFDQGLVTVTTEAVGDLPGDRVKLRFRLALTDAGRAFQQRANTAYAGYNIFFLRIGETVVDEVTGVTAKGNEATVYFTQKFGKATPFAAYADNFGRAETTPKAMTASLVHNGKEWVVKSINEGSQ